MRNHLGDRTRSCLSNAYMMGRAGMDFSLDKNLDEMMEYAINACSAVDSHHP